MRRIVQQQPQDGAQGARMAGSAMKRGRRRESGALGGWLGRRGVARACLAATLVAVAPDVAGAYAEDVMPHGSSSASSGATGSLKGTAFAARVASAATSLSVQDPVLSRDPVAEYGGRRFSDEVSVVLSLRAPSLDLLHTTVDGHRVTWHRDGDTWSCVRSFGEGGPYTLPSMEARDASGATTDNSDQVRGYGQFWVDRHAPTVTAARLEAAGSIWYADDGTLAVDGTAGPGRLVLEVEDALGLGSAGVVSVDGAVTDLGVQPGVTAAEVVIPLPADGMTEDSLSVRLCDLSGNVRLWGLGDQGLVTDAAGSDPSNTPVGIDAGQGALVHPRRVVVDEGEPTLEVWGVDDGGLYGEEAAVRVRVRDDRLDELRSCDPQRVVASLVRMDGGKDAACEDLRLCDLSDEGDGSCAGVLTASEDGTYRLEARFEDLAGRATPAASLSFEVDRSAPDVRVLFDGSPGWLSSEREALVVVEDPHADPGLVDIATSGSIVAWRREGDSLVVPVRFGEGMHHLSVRASDTLGNEAEEVALEPFVVDLTAPVFGGVSFAPRIGRSYGNGLVAVAAGDASLLVDVSDDNGLALVSSSGSADAGGFGVTLGKDTSGRHGQVAVRLREGVAVEAGTQLGVSDLAGNVARVTMLELLSRAWGEDLSGVRQVVLDGTRPVLALEGPDVGSCTHGPASVVLAAREASLPLLREVDPGQTVLTVRRTDGSGPAGSSVLELPLSALEPAGATEARLEQMLAEDGCYEVDARLEDVAGNVARAFLGPFVIDTTAPELAVTFEDEVDVAVHKGPRVAHVHVVERNFDESLVRIDTDGSVGAWTSSGDVHELTVTFGSDGPHHLSARCEDRAGNAAVPYESGEFVVDGTAPSIRVDGVEDGRAYAGPVAGTVTIEDVQGLDWNSVRVTLRRGNGDEVAQSAVEVQGSRAVVTLPDLPLTRETDDIYTLEVRASDLAGNGCERSVRFSLNRFGSTFEVEDDSLAHGMAYLRVAPTVRIREVNVCGSQTGHRRVWLTRDLATELLQLASQPGGGGFSVVEARDERGWSCATYVVGAGNFTRDGTYRVVVGSDDLAGNSNLSVTPGGDGASGEASFVLDTRPPEVTVDGIAEGEVVRGESQTVDVVATDGVGVESLEATLDGAPLPLLEAGPEHWSAEVPARDDDAERTLEVRACDRAGNTTTVRVAGFRVERGRAWSGRSPLAAAGWSQAAGVPEAAPDRWASVLVAAAGAVGGAVWLVHRGRRPRHGR